MKKKSNPAYWSFCLCAKGTLPLAALAPLRRLLVFVKSVFVRKFLYISVILVILVKVVQRIV